MDWRTQLNADPLPWLLEEGEPVVRYLALRDLLGRPAGNPELESAKEAADRHGQIATVLDAMNHEGYWVKPGPGYGPKYKSTVWAITLLGLLGADPEFDPRIGRGCSYLMDHALAEGGQFSYNGAPSGTFDCLQGNLCRALTEMGIRDPRLDRAFEWMARTVTGEGIAPQQDKHNPDRFYAYQCGPNFACGANNKLPCAWGAGKVMQAFASLPAERRTPAIQRAIQAGIDFFFSVDPADGAYPVGDGSKPSGNWWKFGFPVFYVTDILQVADILVRLGCSAAPRLARTLELIRSKQDAQGRWALEYDYTSKSWGYYGTKKKPNKWVTLRALRVLKAVAG